MADVKPVNEGAELPEKRKLDIPSPFSKSLEVSKDESNSNKRPKTEVTSDKNSSIAPPAAENVTEPDGRPEKISVAEEKNDDHKENNNNAEEDEDVPEEPKIGDRKGKGIMIDEGKGKGIMIDEGKGKGIMIDDGKGKGIMIDYGKGKGIMIENKGKGIMLEDSEDDDDDSEDDDSSSDDSDSDFSDGLDDSDFEDFAEVDLDNILPSRTRHPQGQGGVHIGGSPDKALSHLYQ